MGVGSALLAGALTAGAVTAVTSRGTTSTSTSSAPAAAAGPGTSAASATQPEPPVTGGTTSPNWAAVAAAVEPSVVSVRVEAGNGSGDEGSGVVLDAKGHVLTNNHVVAAAGAGGSISVVLVRRPQLRATVVGTDPSTDLAVLALTSPPPG